jgi:hypothetical protein
VRLAGLALELGDARQQLVDPRQQRLVVFVMLWIVDVLIVIKLIEPL